MKVQPFVFYWGDATDYLQYIQEQFGVTPIHVNQIGHEPDLLNYALMVNEAEYVWFLTPDVELYDPGVLDSLVEVLDENPKVGAVIPNRQRDPFVGGRKAYKKYLQDGTGLLYRYNVGARFDTSFVFTGWNDIDFGLEIERRDYEVWVDPRVAVAKKFTPYGSWSSFRSAYNARNRILLEAKWWWSKDRIWHGVTHWNNQNKSKWIPSQFELAWWDDETLEKFAGSVNMEHPQILIKDGQGPGNEDWSWNG